MNRRCYACDLWYSYSGWYLNRGTDLALCKKCFDDIIRRPKRFQTQKERSVWASESRKGINPTNKGYILVPDRICFACGTSKTFRDKRGIRHWRINRDENGNELQALCVNCWSRYIQNPITHAKHNTMRIHFKGKDIYLDHNPRTGFCSKCGKVGKTQLHHEVYDDSDVLANTIELCVSCHSKRSIELGQFAEPFLRKKS